MRALVIAGASLYLMPYAFPYINELISQDFEVTTIVWNRDGKNDVVPDEKVHVIYFNSLLDDAAPKYKKFLAFMRFRRAVQKEICVVKPDCIIVLDTQFAVLFSGILLKKYRGRFIYDMRDPSYERYVFYRKRVKKIIDASAGVFISSDGYRQYLPESEKIYITHNLRTVDLKMRGLRNKYERVHSPLRISFWGIVRDTGINMRLIDALANDNRFVLQYFGTMSEDSSRLLGYCQTKGISNVAFYGSYTPDERYEFAKETDIIHNLYSNSYNDENPCIGNKYYDSLIFCIPQIGTAGGYMGKLISTNAIGISVDIDEHLGDKIWEYYHLIRWNEFKTNCDATLNKILKEYSEAENRLSEIVRGWSGIEK